MTRFLLLSLLTMPVWACSCGGYPSAKEAWLETPLVFAGIVERTDPKGIEHSMSGSQSAFVRVTEPFKGVKKDQLIELRDQLSSCFGGFQEGAFSLFYVFPGEKQGTWIAPACHRTRRMSDAADDLRFLRGLPDTARGNRVSGTIRLYEDDPANGVPKVHNVAGTRVRAVNAGNSHETVTDAEGLYEFRDLLPGTYKIEFDVPKATKLYFASAAGKIKQQQRRQIASLDKSNVLEVTEDSGNGFDFYLAPDTRIVGRVLDPEGKPMKDVCVEADPVASQRTGRSRIYDCTEPDGTYALDRVPAGSYRTVANQGNRLTAASPFGRLYYPGATEAGKAQVVSVTAGQNLEGIDFHVPELARRIELRGRLTFANGVPLPRQSVDFRTEDGYREHIQTDENGNFAMKVVAGRPGKLIGNIMVWGETRAACPQFGLKAEANSWMSTLETIAFPIAGDGSMPQIELVFPVPACDAWLKREAEQRARLKR